MLARLAVRGPAEGIVASNSVYLQVPWAARERATAVGSASGSNTHVHAHTHAHAS